MYLSILKELIDMFLSTWLTISSSTRHKKSVAPKWKNLLLFIGTDLIHRNPCNMCNLWFNDLKEFLGDRDQEADEEHRLQRVCSWEHTKKNCTQRTVMKWIFR
jgi:hypothetical protein